MASITPNARTWTLRFKNNRCTVLLEVDPLQKMDSVRAELLHAIQETHPSGKLNGHEIPKDPADIRFGRAIDRNKLGAGFISMDSGVEEAGADASAKRKGKSAAGTAISISKGKASLGAVMDCPQGAGLKNGDVVAFKFRADNDAAREGGATVDIEEEWDVKVPTFEDTYGDDEAQDEGAELGGG